MLSHYMADKKLESLINDALGYSNKFKGVEMKNRELINRVDAIVRHIDNNYSTSIMDEADINTSRLSCNLLYSLVKEGKIKFSSSIDTSGFDEEIERLDDRVETQEIAVNINDTLSETLKLANV